MDEKKGWFLVVAVLFIMVLVSFALIWVVMDTMQRTVQPVQSMTGDLATQLASVLQPSPTVLPSPITVIKDIRSLARLETIQYTVEKVITVEQNQGVLSPFFGDKLILVGHGKVIAGIDLAKLSAEDIRVENGLLRITLPEPEIFISALDNQKSYVYDRDTGLLTKGDLRLESTARLEAEKQISLAALEDGILDLARQNSEAYLSRLLSDLGYPEVVFEPSPPAAPLAATSTP